MAQNKCIYDVAVVGAGIVGSATALALAKRGRRVALVERQPPRRVRGALGFDARTVALTPDSVSFLRGLAGIDASELSVIEAMRVWEYDGGASIGFALPLRPADSSPGRLAFVAENSDLTTRLWNAASRSLDLYAPSSVTGIRNQPDAVELVGPEIAARLVIAADGAASSVGKLAGVAQREQRARPQRAIATVVRAARGHRNVAYQRFGRSGPVALLPLRSATEPPRDAGVEEPVKESTVAVIWSTSEPENQRLRSLSDDAFGNALHAETEGVLGQFEAIDRRVSFPVRQALAGDFNPLPRVLIVGDAARTLHPLAGQGVNVGLEDARAIVASSDGHDLGSAGRWRAFARERRMRSKLMIASMRALLAAYCGPHASKPWMRLARNTGVRWIDASPGLKAQLVREAMGLGPLSFGGEWT